MRGSLHLRHSAGPLPGEILQSTLRRQSFPKGRFLGTNSNGFFGLVNDNNIIQNP